MFFPPIPKKCSWRRCLKGLRCTNEQNTNYQTIRFIPEERPASLAWATFTFSFYALSRLPFGGRNIESASRNWNLYIVFNSLISKSKYRILNQIQLIFEAALSSISWGRGGWISFLWFGSFTQKHRSEEAKKNSLLWECPIRKKRPNYFKVPL